MEQTDCSISYYFDIFLNQPATLKSYQVEETGQNISNDLYYFSPDNIPDLDDNTPKSSIEITDQNCNYDLYGTINCASDPNILESRESYSVQDTEQISIQPVEQTNVHKRPQRLMNNDDQNLKAFVSSNSSQIKTRGRPSKSNPYKVKQFKDYNKIRFERFGNSLVEIGSPEHEKHVARRNYNTQKHREKKNVKKLKS